MKNIIRITLLFLCYNAYSQSLSVFDLDTRNFPTITAKFYAYDDLLKQILNLSTSDFEVFENGQPRVVTNVTCPIPKPPIPISSVLVMDISGSMRENGLDIAKAAANAWVDMLSLTESECAITSFSDFNYLNQDFTKNKTKLKDGINSLACMDGTNYDAALLDPAAGGILIAKKGKYKRVIVFLTDGSPNFIPNTAQIISQAKADNISIFCVTINMKAPQYIKDFASQTGGICFENIRTKEEAEDCYRTILITSQLNNPCTIEWQGGYSCKTEIKNVVVRLLQNNKTANLSYISPLNSIAKLEFNPAYLEFYNETPGLLKDTIITVTAKNSNYNVTYITSSNPGYEITPTSFSLNPGESRNLTVSYIPADSGFTYCKFDFINDFCPTQYSAIGGFPGKKPTVQTLKLIHPNGGQVLVVGKDTVITWSGVLSNEKVRLEYSTNDGKNWQTISDSATGLSYKWRIPKTPSNLCLARVTAHASPEQFICENGVVHIGNQDWMCKNLDVEIYSNGDLIPEIKDPIQWINATTGAWCYYNNNPVMGKIFGKLYNWYAVNDPRGLAPKGWHIPSDEEWSELENFLGGSSIAGEKLKETGTAHWQSPNTEATNESGFTALPGGWRGNAYGDFDAVGVSADWWTSTEYDLSWAWNRYLGSTIGISTPAKISGFSVRCVKNK